MDPSSLLRVLKVSVEGCIGHEARVAIAYSGGLDSSLIAILASERAEIVCYSCATTRSWDDVKTPHYAEIDGVELKTIILTEDILPEVISRTSRALDSLDPNKIAYSIPLLVVLERCEEKVVLAGNGADELFGGYEKYARGSRDVEDQMRRDLQKSVDESARLERFARSIGKSICLPFLREELIAAASSIPVHEKIDGGVRKKILRDLGRNLGLEAAERPKKAAQYSSGTLRMMRSMARKRGQTLSQLTESIVNEHVVDKD